jgi:hypothetical protein
MLRPMRRGQRTVILAPTVGLRLGNFLYLWLRAHARSHGGSPTAVRESEAMAAWLEIVPELTGLTIAPADLRFRDRREWDAAFLYQRFGIDFSREQLHAFVSEVLAPHVPLDESDAVVVNIRRGDYYTDFREKYAFDQPGYVREALTHFADVPRILVVSDDARWCRENLDDLLREVAPEVAYADPDAWGNFIAVAGARRIVGTNSTFSYWAAYAADALHDDAQIVMPRFHARAPHAIDAHQLDPRWTAIDGYH